MMSSGMDFIQSFLEMPSKTHQEVFLTNILCDSKSNQVDMTGTVEHHK